MSSSLVGWGSSSLLSCFLFWAFVYFRIGAKGRALLTLRAQLKKFNHINPGVLQVRFKNVSEARILFITAPFWSLETSPSPQHTHSTHTLSKLGTGARLSHRLFGREVVGRSCVWNQTTNTYVVGILLALELHKTISLMLVCHSVFR